MNIAIIEKDGQRVLTSAQLAESYGTDNRRISENFNENKERYKPRKHFRLLERDNLKRFDEQYGNSVSVNRVSKLYLWTEIGALLHAKSLNTEDAWDAYELLVDDYYRIRSEIRVLSPKEQIMASMKLTLETAQEVKEIKGKVEQFEDKIDNQIMLDYGMQRRLQMAVGARVYTLTEDERE